MILDIKMEITTLLVYFAAIIEKADEQVLPAVYLFAGTSWKATPVQLGQITLCRALVQVRCSSQSMAEFRIPHSLGALFSAEWSLQ